MVCFVRHFTYFWVFTFALNANAMYFGAPDVKMVFPAVAEESIKIRPKTRGPIRCESVYPSGILTFPMTVFSIGGAPTKTPIPGRYDIQTELNGGVEMVPTPTGKPAKIHQQLFEDAMEQWGRDFGFSESQISLLRGINHVLPAHRVYWIQVRFESQHLGGFPQSLPPEYHGLASIRATDTSRPLQKVFGLEVKYDQNLAGERPDYTSPVELSPKNIEAGYKLPRFGRAEGLPVYSWHLGIGTNQKGFEGGLHSMFTRVAEHLDNNYNNSHFKTFRETDLLDSLEMVVYSSTKPSSLKFYEGFGFEVLHPVTGLPVKDVIYINRKGEAQASDSIPLLPDGMVLIGMKASEFMKKYSDLAEVPTISYETSNFKIKIGGRTEKDPRHPDVAFAEGNKKAFRRIEDLRSREDLVRRIDEVEQMQNAFAMAVNRFVATHPQVYRMDRPEQDFFKGNKDWNELVKIYRQFALHLYSVVNNVPKELRDDTWYMVYVHARSMLVKTPLEAFQSIEPDSTNTTSSIFEALKSL